VLSNHPLHYPLSFSLSSIPLRNLAHDNYSHNKDMHMHGFRLSVIFVEDAKRMVYIWRLRRRVEWKPWFKFNGHQYLRNRKKESDRLKMILWESECQVQGQSQKLAALEAKKIC
jgi:hypothetical protein